MCEKKNLVAQKYVSDCPNLVICVDVSYLSSKSSYLVGIDLATRVVVGHLYKKTPIQVEDVLKFLDVVLEARSFTDRVCIVHSDRESLFSTDRYKDFLLSKNVIPSRGSSKGHDNQVVERLHRTLKNHLKVACVKHKPHLAGRQFSFNGFSSIFLEKSLNEAVELYNNDSHKANSHLSPNGMDEAFLSFADKVVSNSLIPMTSTAGPVTAKGLTLSNSKALIINNSLVKNDNSLESLKIKKVREMVALRFAYNWEAFFISFLQNQAVKDERLFAENLLLRKQLTEVQNVLNTVAEESAAQKNIRHKRELAKQKRDLSSKMPLRDVVLPEELSMILDKCSSYRFSSCRRRLAFVLLYLTGLRVSNLLILTVKQVKELFLKGDVTISLIKNGPSRHSIIVSEKGLDFLNKYKKTLNLLCQNKKGSDLLFTTEKSPDKSITRASFDNELNVILKECSLFLGKHLRTHSFRATFITDLLKSTPIDVVKDVVGHSDIKSTLTYKRSRLSKETIQKVIKTLDPLRKKA